MIDIKNMNSQELLELQKSNTPLTLAQRRFRHYYTRLEQENMQRTPQSSLDNLRLEFEAIQDIASTLGVHIPESNTNDAYPLKFIYKNYRGEISERHVIPKGHEFISTEWHPEKQWIMVGLDLEKNAIRYFAMKDIIEWK